MKQTRRMKTKRLWIVMRIFGLPSKTKMRELLGRRLGRPPPFPILGLSSGIPYSTLNSTSKSEIDVPAPSSPIHAPVVAVRTMDGRLLKDHALTSTFDLDATALFNSDMDVNAGSLTAIRRVLNSLKVEQGMLPPDDPWVVQNIINPALESSQLQLHLRQPFNSVGEFIETLRNVVLDISSRMEKNTVDLITTRKIYDGKATDQFLQNNCDLSKALHTIWKSLPKDEHGALPKEYLRVALDIVCPAAGLPSLGTIDEMDRLFAETFILWNVDNGSTVNQKEFENLLMEMLDHITFKLREKPISVSCHVVDYNKNKDS